MGTPTAVGNLLPVRLPWRLLAGTSLAGGVYALTATITPSILPLTVVTTLLLAAFIATWSWFTDQDCKARWPSDLASQLPPHAARIAAMGVTAASVTAVAALSGNLTPFAVAVAASAGLWGLAAIIDVTTQHMPAPLLWGSVAVAAPTAVTATLTAELPPMWVVSVIGPAVITLLWLITPRGMGMSDVRLAWALWVALFWWQPAMVPVWGLILASVGQLAIHLVLAVARRHRRNLPFGPALVCGTLLAAACSPLIP